MIPKIVHYCWYGNNPKSAETLYYIETWRKFLPNYEFIEWNEGNCDIKCCHFTREAYYLKKYAFVSDYFRMKALYDYGGLYLDTDVEMIKDISALTEKGEFVGMETDGLYGTGILCAEPKSAWVGKMLNWYTKRHFFTWKGMLNSWANTIILTELYPKGSLPVTIYPIDYLTAIDWKTGKSLVSTNTYTIHHYALSWAPPKYPRQIIRIINYFKFLNYYLMRLMNKA